MVRQVSTWLLLILVIDIISLSDADSFNSNVIISESGSEFNYYFETTSYNKSTGFQIIRGEDFVLNIGIEIVKFGSDVQYLYNVLLYLRVVNNEGLFVDNIAYLDRINSLGRAGTIWNFESSELQYNSSENFIQYYTNFNILVGVAFSESLLSTTTDPFTEDPIHFLHEVDIVSESYRSTNEDAADTISNGEEKFAQNLNITEEPPPTTSIPPAPPDTPNLISVAIFIMILGGIFILGRKLASPLNQGYKGYTSLKVKLSNYEKSKPKDISVSMKLCPNCGTISPEASQFCMECGVHLP